MNSIKIYIKCPQCGHGIIFNPEIVPNDISISLDELNQRKFRCSNCTHEFAMGEIYRERKWPDEPEPMNDVPLSQYMTLRDYFAGQALAGLLAGAYSDIESISDKSFIYADAMIEKRNKK